MDIVNVYWFVGVSVLCVGDFMIMGYGSEHWYVEVWSVNDRGTVDVFEAEVDSIMSATRLMNTFRGKRGYKITNIKVERRLL